MSLTAVITGPLPDSEVNGGMEVEVEAMGVDDDICESM